jgi:hypothetical protein
MLVTDWQEAVVIAYLTGWVYSTIDDWARYYHPQTREEIWARSFRVRAKQQFFRPYLLDICRILIGFIGGIFWPIYLVWGFYSSVIKDPMNDEAVLKLYDAIETAYKSVDQKDSDDPDHP